MRLSTVTPDSLRRQTQFERRAKIAIFEQGLSIAALARILNVRRETVSLAINKPGRAAMKRAIAHALGISI